MLYSTNQTSACLLLVFAQKNWIENNPSADAQDHQRYLMVHDLYIKARSFSIINKVAFWFALLGGIAVLLWPMTAELSSAFHWNEHFFRSAIVQTTITAFAGLAFALYSHYKKRQMFVENLMRSIVYAEDWEPAMAERVIKEMERIDSGFGFAETFTKKTKTEKNADEKSS